MSSRNIFQNLSDTCGKRCLVIYRQLLEETKRIEFQSERKRFLLRCVRQKLAPRSLWFRLPGRFEKNRNLKWKMTREMLRMEVSSLSRSLTNLCASRDLRLECVRRMVGPSELWARLLEHLRNCSLLNGERAREDSSQRLTRLQELHGLEMERNSMSERGRGSILSRDSSPSTSNGTGIVNLSSGEFTPAEIRVLNKGLDFSIVPKRVDNADVAASIEFALRKVDVADRGMVRREAARAVGKFKSGGGNLDPEERDALRSLRGREDVIFLTADKGKCTVVLDMEEYKAKLGCLVQEGPYVCVRSDPGQRFRKRLYELLKPLSTSGTLDRATFLRWCPASFETPHIFGRPKVHKSGCPLRPIVSMRGSLFAPLGRVLAGILLPYMKDAESYVENSKDFKEKLLASWDQEEPNTMVSFDVVSLFTKVPVREALEVVRRFLSDDDSLSSLAVLSLILTCSVVCLISF